MLSVIIRSEGKMTRPRKGRRKDGAMSGTTQSHGCNSRHLPRGRFHRHRPKLHRVDHGCRQLGKTKSARFGRTSTWHLQCEVCSAMVATLTILTAPPECLYVQREHLRILDEVIDFEAVGSSSTLSLSTDWTSDDEVGHDAMRGVGVNAGFQCRSRYVRAAR